MIDLSEQAKLNYPLVVSNVKVLNEKIKAGDSNQYNRHVVVLTLSLSVAANHDIPNGVIMV